jgi:nicotinamidase-related amidase
MRIQLALFVIPAVSACMWIFPIQSSRAADQKPLALSLRSRRPAPADPQRVDVTEKQADWRPEETALIICDVWDHHWCKGAEKRLAPLLPQMNAFTKEARQRGVLIIHSPSGTIQFYENTPQRALAKNAPLAQPPSPLKGWNYLDKTVESALPIDDSDGGCDCDPRCSEKPYPWTRQHQAIEIADGDAISDQGQEIYNLLHARNIRHVLIMGVHANMCVLGRPFGIRQLVRFGYDVALVRDLTDTMYNHRMRPFVPHDKGTELVIEHIERFWCPSIISSQIPGEAKQR